MSVPFHGWFLCFTSGWFINISVNAVTVGNIFSVSVVSVCWFFSVRYLVLVGFSVSVLVGSLILVSVLVSSSLSVLSVFVGSSLAVLSVFVGSLVLVPQCWLVFRCQCC